MEHLDCVIQDLEDRINVALAALSNPNKKPEETVSLGISIYPVEALVRDTYTQDKKEALVLDPYTQDKKAALAGIKKVN